MPDTEIPRSHIQPVPLPIPSQIPHLRSSNQKESCDWENYERSDDRKLILSALGQEQTKQNNQAYLGEKPYPLGRHIHIWLIQGSTTTPPDHIVLPASCTCHLLYFLCCLLYLDVVSSFLLTSSCLLVTSKHQLFTADYVSFILY